MMNYSFVTRKKINVFITAFSEKGKRRKRKEENDRTERERNIKRDRKKEDGKRREKDLMR